MKAFPVLHTSALKIWLSIFTILLFCSCKKNGPGDTHGGTTKPNIILILADDIGYEVPTYTGGQSYSTPSIDNLAANGIQFTQCHVCPDCSPTRVELLTGKYNFRNYTGWGSLNPNQKTIANMLHDAGYKTCVAGKWQLGGGDESIHAFGFDKYRIFEPFYTDDETQENLYRYKNPRLYENGNYLPDNVTKGKYADDMFADYISDFIDSNLSSPFFVYFPLSLCHRPFSPTPDDAAFAQWDPLVNTPDSIFFPSMVHYMDKKVQQIVDKVASAGLENNTLIIFLGDNGTPPLIHSLYNGQMIQGGKETTTMYGTKVPFIVKWTGTIAAGQKSAGLIDASDFLPTLASVANTKTPSNYGTLDGINFKPLFFGSQQRLRDWIYCYWFPQSKKPFFKVWVHDENYKLYDTTNQSFFFNIAADPFELNPIPDNQLTATEVNRKKTFDSVLNIMH